MLQHCVGLAHKRYPSTCAQSVAYMYRIYVTIATRWFHRLLLKYDIYIYMTKLSHKSSHRASNICYNFAKDYNALSPFPRWQSLDTKPGCPCTIFSLSWIGVTLKTNDPLDHSSPLESFWTSKSLNHFASK
jgi:hypothetical protein